MDENFEFILPEPDVITPQELALRLAVQLYVGYSEKLSSTNLTDAVLACASVFEAYINEGYEVEEVHEADILPLRGI